MDNGSSGEMPMEGANVVSNESSSSESSPTPTEPKEAPKAKFKLSTGEEIEESELLRRDEYVKAANKRFQDAAAERKAAAEERAKVAKEKAEAEALLQKIKEDPWKVMEELGLNARELAEAKLLAELQQEMLSPEQKRIQELEIKAKTYEQKEAERKKAEEEKAELEKKSAEEKELIQLTEKAKEDLSNNFLKALETSSLPRTPTSIRRVAEKLYQSRLAGEEIPVEHAVKLTELEQKEGLSEYFNNLSIEQIIEFIGEEKMNQVKKHEVSKLKNPIPSTKVQVKDESKSTKSTTPSYKDPHEFIKELKRKHGVI